MKIIDPGHSFLLDLLDLPLGGGKLKHPLTFVKRMGPKFPGNDSAYFGTTLQEVYRGCAARLRYLENQSPCAETRLVKIMTQECILLLEERAARIHGRPPIEDVKWAEFGITCPLCLHVGCRGNCRK